MAIPSKGLQDYSPKMTLDGLHLHKCAGVPDDALAGHPKGCLVVDTTNGALYINTGTASSTTYNNIQAVLASEIALATGSIMVGAAGVGAALAKGTANQMLHMNSGATAPEWVSPLAGLVESTTATATADGLTTGSITALTGLKKFVAVTSGGATDAITLPGINASTIGQEIFLTVGANGYELLTVASSNVTINQVDCDGTNQLDVAANTTVRCTQISTTAWLAETIAATTIAITAPDND